MRDSIVLASAIVLALGTVLGCYLLGSHGFTITTESAPRTLVVSAEGKVKIEPDTIILSAGAEVSRANTQADAYQEMTESANAIKEILKDAGIEDKNVQTSNLSVSQNYRWENGKNILDGYNASENLTITIQQKDTGVTDSILDQIAQVKNITINSISYDVADKEPLYTEARKAALLKARTKADEMAATAGVDIVGITSISENANSYYPMATRNYAMMDMAVGASESAGSAISIGQVDYTTTVNVSYEIR